MKFRKNNTIFQQQITSKDLYMSLVHLKFAVVGFCFDGPSNKLDTTYSHINHVPFFLAFTFCPSKCSVRMKK